MMNPASPADPSFIIRHSEIIIPTPPPPEELEFRMTEKHSPHGSTGHNAELGSEDLAAVKKIRDAFNDIKAQLARVIVGQDQVIEELLIAMFSRGHCILEGVPGLAKTLMISTLAKSLSLDFSRIQFTP